MKTKTLLTTLAVVSVLAIVNVAAAAEGVTQTPQGKQFGQQGVAQMKEVRQAVENEDYETWKKLTEEHPRAAEMFKNISADNFHLLNEMYQARQDGDMEKVKEIADQLGLRIGPMARKVKHHKMREEIRTALKNRDYEAWHDAMMPPIFQYVNEGNFDTFVDMHEAMQAGDKDKADELRAQLGLPERPVQHGRGQK